MKLETVRLITSGGIRCSPMNIWMMLAPNRASLSEKAKAVTQTAPNTPPTLSGVGASWRRAQAQ